jgi:hypothetical protein
MTLQEILAVAPDPAGDMSMAAHAMFDSVGNITAAGTMYRQQLNRAIKAGAPIIAFDRPGAVAEDLLTRAHVDPATRQLRDKTICPATLDGLTLASLPTPCTIHITDPAGTITYEVDEPALALSFPHLGTYGLRISSAPFLDGEFTVTVP